MKTKAFDARLAKYYLEKIEDYTDLLRTLSYYAKVGYYGFNTAMESDEAAIEKINAYAKELFDSECETLLFKNIFYDIYREFAIAYSSRKLNRDNPLKDSLSDAELREIAIDYLKS